MSADPEHEILKGHEGHRTIRMGAPAGIVAQAVCLTCGLHIVQTEAPLEQIMISVTFGEDVKAEVTK